MALKKNENTKVGCLKSNFLNRFGMCLLLTLKELFCYYILGTYTLQHCRNMPAAVFLKEFLVTSVVRCCCRCVAHTAVHTSLIPRRFQDRSPVCLCTISWEMPVLRPTAENRGESVELPHHWGMLRTVFTTTLELKCSHLQSY